MAAFLGLPRADRIDDLELVELIAKGLPTKTTETVVRRIDPHEQFLRATDIFPKSTYRRRVKARSLSRKRAKGSLRYLRYSPWFFSFTTATPSLPLSSSQNLILSLAAAAPSTWQSSRTPAPILS